MARDVNALINKCENAITQEEKTISDAKEKIRKLRSRRLAMIALLHLCLPWKYSAMKGNLSVKRIYSSNER